MELYNFFTEVIIEKDTEKFENLKFAEKELHQIFGDSGHFKLVLFTGTTKEKRYSIVGQIYGSDTNVGDIDLLTIFKDIKYTWFDAFCPEINNLNEKI